VSFWYIDGLATLHLHLLLLVLLFELVQLDEESEIWLCLWISLFEIDQRLFGCEVVLTDEVGEHKSGGPGYSSLAMNEHFIALVNAVY
jgi:hypothetical protein